MSRPRDKIRKPTRGPGPREAEACEAIQDLIPRLVESRLSRAEAEVVERHLVRCAACRCDLESSRKLAGALRPHLAGPEPPQGFPGQVKKRLKRG